MTLNELTGPPGVTQLRERRTVAGKILQKVSRGVAKVGLAPIRNAWLVAMKANLYGIAAKLKFGYGFYEVAQRYGYSYPQWQFLQKQLRQVENTFVKAGGRAENLKSAILMGKGNRGRSVGHLWGLGVASAGDGSNSILVLVQPIADLLQALANVLASVVPQTQAISGGIESALSLQFGELTGPPTQLGSFSDRDYWSPSQVQQTVLPNIDFVIEQYAPIIERVSEWTGVPARLIAAVIVKESEGDHLANIRPHVFQGQKRNRITPYKGLMQISGPVALTAIFENRKTITPQVRAELERYIGVQAVQLLLEAVLNQSMVIRLPNGQVQQVGSKLEPLVREQLDKPAFNILCGSLYLAYLLRRNGGPTNVRLAKVVAQYNGGHNVTVAGDTLAQVRASISAYRHYNSAKKREILTYIDAIGGPSRGILALIG